MILTVSRAEQDVLRAHQFGADAYVTKPVDLRQFIGIIEAIEEFSLTISVLPRELQPAV